MYVRSQWHTVPVWCVLGLPISGVVRCVCYICSNVLQAYHTIPYRCETFSDIIQNIYSQFCQWLSAVLFVSLANPGNPVCIRVCIELFWCWLAVRKQHLSNRRRRSWGIVVSRHSRFAQSWCDGAHTRLTTISIQLLLICVQCRFRISVLIQIVAILCHQRRDYQLKVHHEAFGWGSSQLDLGVGPQRGRDGGKRKEGGQKERRGSENISRLLYPTLLADLP